MTIVHAMAEVATPRECEGLCVEIQKIERHFEEEHESTKLRQVAYTLQKRVLCCDKLCSCRQAGNGVGNIESPRLMFRHDKDHKSEHKRRNGVQEHEATMPPEAEPSLSPPFTTAYKPTHAPYEGGQEDHPGDRTPKAFHRTTQDVTSKEICAQCITIPWGKKLIVAVNFHRIVEQESWRPHGDSTENQETPEASIDCLGGGRAWSRGWGSSRIRLGVLVGRGTPFAQTT